MQEETHFSDNIFHNDNTLLLSSPQENTEDPLSFFSPLGTPVGGFGSVGIDSSSEQITEDGTFVREVNSNNERITCSQFRYPVLFPISSLLTSFLGLISRIILISPLTLHNFAKRPKEKMKQIKSPSLFLESTF
jgi:hypothetical protein